MSTTASVNLCCPKCQKGLRLTQALLGKPVKCPGCLTCFVAPQPAPPPLAETVDWAGVAADPSPQPTPAAEPSPSTALAVEKDQEPDDNQRFWATAVHLTQLGAWVLPFVAGTILPIVIWRCARKAEGDLIDRNGKHAANWIVSFWIYQIVAVVLSFLLVGIPIVAALLVAMTVLPIVGATKASRGEEYRYPLSLTFFR